MYHEPTLPKHKRSVAYAKSDYHYDSRSSRYCYDTRKDGTHQLQSQKSIPDMMKVQLHQNPKILLLSAEPLQL